MPNPDLMARNSGKTTGCRDHRDLEPTQNDAPEGSTPTAERAPNRRSALHLTHALGLSGPAHICRSAPDPPRTERARRTSADERRQARPIGTYALVSLDAQNAGLRWIRLLADALFCAARGAHREPESGRAMFSARPAKVRRGIVGGRRL